MKIDFEIISHRKHRYETVGDYFKQRGVWFFRVSRMKDKRYSMLVFAHEFIEWLICQVQKIKATDIDKFDVAYESARQKHLNWKENGESRLGKAPCGCTFYDEPGDDIHAPYREAHQVATACERLIAKALGVEWAGYEEAVEKL